MTRKHFISGLVGSGIAALSGDLRAATQPLGTKLGSFNGVDCYSNGYVGRYSSKDPVNTVTVKINGKNQTIETGQKWQCTEYVSRYYALIYLMKIKGGDANTYYGKAKTKGLTAYADGGKELPKVGDILCWGGGKGGYGHVAIIRSVGSDYVKIIQQNRYCTTDDNSQKVAMTVTKDKYGKVSSVKIDNKAVNSNGSYWTQGWLRKP